MKKNLASASNRPYTHYTALDRILERVLDYFDEVDGGDLQDPCENLDRRSANLEVLKRRIAVALYLFGDTRRAYLLGFPADPETQETTLEQCSGDVPGRFVAVYTIDGSIHQDERMALCLLQAEVEFRHHLARKFGDEASLIEVRAVKEPAGE